MRYQHVDDNRALPNYDDPTYFAVTPLRCVVCNQPLAVLDTYDGLCYNCDYDEPICFEVTDKARALLLTKEVAAVTPVAAKGWKACISCGEPATLEDVFGPVCPDCHSCGVLGGPACNA